MPAGCVDNAVVMDTSSCPLPPRFPPYLRTFCHNYLQHTFHPPAGHRFFVAYLCTRTYILLYYIYSSLHGGGVAHHRFLLSCIPIYILYIDIQKKIFNKCTYDLTTRLQKKKYDIMKLSCHWDFETNFLPRANFFFIRSIPKRIRQFGYILFRFSSVFTISVYEVISEKILFFYYFIYSAFKMGLSELHTAFKTGLFKLHAVSILDKSI